MSQYNETILTEAGQSLASRAANGQAKFTITRASGSSADLSGKTEAELSALTTIPSEIQDAKIIAQIDDPKGNDGITGTKVTFQNKNEDSELNEGYQLNTIGLYVKEDGSEEEILYAISTAEKADYIPDFADKVVYQFTITIYVIVGQKANVTVTINMTNTATTNYVDGAIAKAMANVDLSEYATNSQLATKADDSKVAHLSGANNFDTVPTVNNNPLLLASSLPSDLARTGSDQEFTGKNTFDTAPIDKTTGNPYITKDGVPAVPSTLADTTKDANFTGKLQKSGVDVATTADLSSYITKDQLTTILKDYIKVDPNTGYVDHTIKVHYGNLLIDSDVVGVNKWVLDEDTAIAQTALYPANNYYVSYDTTTGGAS